MIELFKSLRHDDRVFWNKAYVAGYRITVANGEFVFTQSLTPLLRIAQAGNRFGVFPADKPENPPSWVSDGVAEHREQLMAWLSVEWPARLQAFANHILVLDYELKPLSRFAASQGEHVDGWLADGGRIPYYIGRRKDGKMPAYEPTPLSPILSDYTEVRFV